MLFNSVQFLIFFVIITILFFILKHKYRWILLLIASSIFYITFIPPYIFILLALILIDYTAGIYIEKSQDKKRKLFLLISILSTATVLFIFKYFNFFNVNLLELASFLHWNYSIKTLNLILPVGLSFHTFQSLSYVIEVYKGRFKAEKNLGIYSLYVMFFPQLVAGPIERPQNLLHQFYEEHKFDLPQIVEGLQLMLWGFFLKVVIADRLALIVNQVYNNVSAYTGIPLILSTYLFTFQIFCDFAGYSIIAIGCARVLGFKLMDNFKRPYFSKSIQEFWRRWHISLSTWFKDYVYIPLGGNRVRKSKIILNIMIVFLISGLWHGAAWTFVIWGALHGMFIVISTKTINFREKFCNFIKLNRFPKIHNLIKILITFNLVAFGWIFFRANSLSDSLYVITHLFQGWNINFLQDSLTFGKTELIIIFFLILFMELVHYVQEKKGIRNCWDRIPPLFRMVIYIIFILFILLFGIFENTKFIYFQF